MGKAQIIGKIAVCFLLFVAFQVAAAPRTADDRKEQPAPEGKLSVEKMESHGHAVLTIDSGVECEFVKGTWITYKRKRIVLEEDSVKFYSNKFSELIEIDCGTKQGRICKGIFRIKDGLIEICISAPGGTRPKEFDSKQGILWQMRQLPME